MPFPLLKAGYYTLGDVAKENQDGKMSIYEKQ